MERQLAGLHGSEACYRTAAVLQDKVLWPAEVGCLTKSWGRWIVDSQLKSAWRFTSVVVRELCFREALKKRSRS